MPTLRGNYAESGPILDVFVGVSEPRRRVMHQLGFEPAPFQRVPFLIDTGADTTMVSEQLMRTLGIPQSGSRDIVGSTTHIDPTTCSAHDIAFEIRTPGEAPFAVPALQVLARPFFNSSIEGLIGRDVLNQLELTMGHWRFKLEYR
nr:retropepsin-like aspartic protease [Pseudorhodoferax soli]